MTTIVVDGIVLIGKLMNAWPNDLENYTQVTVADFDDIMRTIDYTLSNYSDCSILESQGKRLVYVKGQERGEHAVVILRNDFLARIKYQSSIA